MQTERPRSQYPVAGVRIAVLDWRSVCGIDQFTTDTGRPPRCYMHSLYNLVLQVG